MEPDEIKKIWNEIDLLKEKQQINENKIKEMLKDKGENSLAKLIGNTRFSTIATIPLGLIFCLACYKFFKAGGYYLIYPLVFLIMCILLIPGGISSIRFLKKIEIDYSTTTVKGVLEKIVSFQDCIKKSQKYVIIGSFFYFGIGFYFTYKLTLGSKIVWWFIIYLIVIHIINTFILIPYVNKKIYHNHINRIKESLKDLKEFEEV
jgi:hypothetical protein